MSADPKRLNDLAAIASIAVAVILIGAKLAIWIATGSVAILGSLVDSGLDAIASMAVRIGSTGVAVATTGTFHAGALASTRTAAVRSIVSFI